MPDFLQDLYERSVVDLPLEQRMLVCIYNLLGLVACWHAIYTLQAGATGSAFRQPTILDNVHRIQCCIRGYHPLLYQRLEWDGVL